MRGEDAAGFPTTCRMLVHPHMRGEQIARSGPDHPHVRGADVHEPNGAVLPWQPGTAVIPNFGDTALRPPRPKPSAPPL